MRILPFPDFLESYIYGKKHSVVGQSKTLVQLLSSLFLQFTEQSHCVFPESKCKIYVLREILRFVCDFQPRKAEFAKALQGVNHRKQISWCSRALSIAQCIVHSWKGSYH